MFLHIIVQGIEKRYIFDNNLYKQKYIDLIHENSKKFNITIIAFCVMNNHTHICLYCDEIQNLSKFMHKINSSYASYYNFLENRVGYVFRNRYYLKEIKDKTQLFNTIAYIHNNPQKAGIVDDASKWSYSTYNDYINCKIPEKTILLVFETREYINIFNEIHRKKIYEEVFDVDEEEIKSNTEIINDFLLKYKISINLIKNEKNLLLELVREMKRRKGFK